MDLRADLKSFHRNQAGFTLVEAAIAGVILVMVLASMLAVASQGYRTLGGLPREQQSSQFLQEKLEDIRLMNWSDIQALPATFSTTSNTNGLFKGTIAKSDYTTKSGAPIVTRVTLTATWTNAPGYVQTNRVTTLISCGGLNAFIY